MDRRQRKTRNAIFEAFISLLSERSYERITVEQIIGRADVGRATFYAHFETKEFLLMALCEELFAHVFPESVESTARSHIFDCDVPDSAFLHLFQHVQKNDNHILDLLSSQNNELFLRCFKENLIRLVRSQLVLFEDRKAPELPESFWVDHIASSFVESVRWWIDNGMKETPETMAKYFFLSV